MSRGDVIDPADTSPPTSTGESFGPFRLLELIGRGGMGEVWRALDTRDDRLVALKRLSDAWARVPEFRERFRREARLTTDLGSRHVVTVHDTGEVDGRIYLTMDLLSGGDVAGLVAEHPAGLPPARAVELVSQVADALDDAHRRGLVHRDVKPSNVLLAGEPAGEPAGQTPGDHAYLVDFGLARAAIEATGVALTIEGDLPGTPAYMAPELFGTGQPGVTTDVYALTCMLFEMLTGRRPFLATSAPALMAQHLRDRPPVPSDVRPWLGPYDALVAAGLAKDPAWRPPTAGDLARVAREVSVGSSAPTVVPVPPPGPPPIEAPPTRVPWWRRRAVLVIAAVVAVLVVVGAVLLAVRPGAQTTAAPARPGETPFVPLRLALTIPSPAGLAFSPDGRRAYVADPDTAADTLSVIDTATRSVVTTIPVGGFPQDVVVSPDGRRAYVTNSGTPGGRPGDSVSVVDTVTNSVVATVPVSSSPLGLAITPDGRRLYVTDPGDPSAVPDSRISVIDTATNAVVATVPVGIGPAGVTVSPDGRRAYVANYGTFADPADTVSVIDTATNTVTATWRLGARGPNQLVVSPDGGTMYAIMYGVPDLRGGIQVVDTTTGASRPLAPGTLDVPFQGALTPDGRTLVVPDSGVTNHPGSTVLVVDTATGASRLIPVGVDPYGVAITPDGRTAWITATEADGIVLLPLS